jgi:hypothetical protein
MNHWKNYDPIPNVVGFDERGDGPHIDPLSVTANCSSSPNWPVCRIALHLGRLAIGALSVEQSAQLRAILERAERDVIAGMAGVVEADPPEVSEAMEVGRG